MKEFILSISAQDWATLGSALTAAVTAIVTAIVNKKGQTISTKQNTALTNMTGGIVDILEGVKNGSDKVIEFAKESSEKIDAAIEAFKSGVSESHKQNLAVASFILECFNQSNLSTEKKAKLQLMFDQMFYDSKDELVTKLQEAKAEAESKLEKAEAVNAKLQEDVTALEDKLSTATANTKKSRRI